jgi:hypothetical protein
MDGVGDEGACDTGLVVSLLSVVEDRASVLDRCGGVREVVGDDLIGVDIAAGGEMLEGAPDNRAGGLDCRRGGGKVGLGYGRGGGGIGFVWHSRGH